MFIQALIPQCMFTTYCKTSIIVFPTIISPISQSHSVITSLSVYSYVVSRI